LIAHELNNISVPLHGFAEHALEHVPGYGVVRECVQELQIGIGRIRALAADLESLGQTDSLFELVPLRDCISRAIRSVQNLDPPIDWCCPKEINVRVDAEHAQRAIASLIRVAVAADSTQNPGSLSIEKNDSKVGNCAVCGASVGTEGDWVLLRTSGIRRMKLDVLRDPFRSDTGGRTSRRLALAVLDRCAHRAGGHVYLNHRADVLTLVLPVL